MEGEWLFLGGIFRGVEEEGEYGEERIEGVLSLLQERECMLQRKPIAPAQIVVHDFAGCEEVGEVPEEEAPPLPLSFEFAHYNN